MILCRIVDVESFVRTPLAHIYYFLGFVYFTHWQVMLCYNENADRKHITLERNHHDDNPLGHQYQQNTSQKYLATHK